MKHRKLIAHLHWWNRLRLLRLLPRHLNPAHQHDLVSVNLRHTTTGLIQQPSHHQSKTNRKLSFVSVHDHQRPMRSPHKPMSPLCDCKSTVTVKQCCLIFSMVLPNETKRKNRRCVAARMAFLPSIWTVSNCLKSWCANCHPTIDCTTYWFPSCFGRHRITWLGCTIRI